MIGTAPSSGTESGPVTVRLIMDWFVEFDLAIAESAPWLTDLDTAIGDGDHGIIMHKGARAARAQADADADADADVAALLARIGAAFGAATGGAGGILFSTLIHGIAAALDGRDAVRLPEFVDAFAAGVARVQDRGRAEPGDKTMIDALVPALVELRSAVADGVPQPTAFARAAASATVGRDATYPMIARRGRASYLGERSENHLDPGAATVAILMHSLATAAVKRG
ncbi:dihydroxyacetone kinase subunit DhaL [Leifsonia shinshuensis]|uniref:Dihydroxyacetone kinase subunit L n=1 Tax=Leifsonia shinshuensis TaxID=150026 RepID=A0A7G6YE12_9MICO|nr:dihydroxyacetone kinase subunit DhaL [Leifsonia shinshuensis]QNE36727.1 dihydroxyacetone kinase subunit L [Leifsonia shinshuensis]